MLAAVGWFVFGREKPIEVRTAPTVALGGGGSAASVLDASGYVVARRMATVSAKITGKVHEVLIEEGMKVDAGQVMATLDPVDADASRALSQAQVEAARSQVANVQAQLTEAEANARRLSSLVQQQLVAQARSMTRRSPRATPCVRNCRPRSATSPWPAAAWPFPTMAWTTPSSARPSPAW